MNDIARVYFIVFGLITIAGAIQGALKGSMISLVAGGILGALILAGGFLIASNPTLGLALGLVGSLGVAGRFFPAFLKTHTIWPHGVLGILGVAAVIIGILGFVKR